MRPISSDNVNLGKQSLITCGTGSCCKRFSEGLIRHYKSKQVILYSIDKLEQYDNEDRHNIKPSLKFCEAGDVECYKNCYKVTKCFYYASNINTEWLREEEPKKLLEAQT